MKTKMLAALLVAIASVSAVAGESTAQPIGPAAASTPRTEQELIALQMLQSSQMQVALLTQLNSEIHSLQTATQQDNSKACYYDGKAYSEGAKYNGQTCASDGIRVTLPDGREKVPPLTWTVQKDK